MLKSTWAAVKAVTFNEINLIGKTTIRLEVLESNPEGVSDIAVLPGKYNTHYAQRLLGFKSYLC